MAASATSAAPTTTTTLVPPATITRVKQAESDLETTAAGITDSTPLLRGHCRVQLGGVRPRSGMARSSSADAGCLTDAQQAEAVAQITAYSAALQTDLADGGLLQGRGRRHLRPETVAAVEQLQTDSGLPVTGLVDQATALALEKKLAKGSLQTAALQSVLKLPGTTPVRSTESGRLS